MKLPSSIELILLFILGFPAQFAVLSESYSEALTPPARDGSQDIHASAGVEGVL